MKPFNLENPSKRHHYLPEFYSKGFTNSKGQLFVYDKQQNNISVKFPKQIFYDWERNTIDFGVIKIDSLERVSSRVDNQIAPVFAKLRNIDNTAQLNGDVDYSYAVLRFVIDRYLKLPANRHLIEKIKPNILKNITDITSLEFYNKILNNDLIAPHLKQQYFDFLLSYLEVREFELKPLPGMNYYSIQIVPDNSLLVSDNPFIFKNEIIGYESIKTNLVIPISHNRLYIGKDTEYINVDMDGIIALNMIQFQQAERYVCSGDRTTLEQYATFYKLMMPFNNLAISKELLFESINVARI